MWAAGTGAGAGGSLVSEETCMKEKLERERENKRESWREKITERN